MAFLLLIPLLALAAEDVQLVGSAGDKVLTRTFKYNIPVGESSNIYFNGKKIIGITVNKVETISYGTQQQFELTVTEIATSQVWKCYGTAIIAWDNVSCDAQFDDGTKVNLNVNPGTVTIGKNYITINSMSITLGEQTLKVPATAPAPSPPVTVAPVAPPADTAKNTCAFALKVATEGTAGVDVAKLNSEIGKVKLLKYPEGTEISIPFKQSTSGFKKKNGDVIPGFFYIFNLAPGKYTFSQSINSKKASTYPNAGEYIEVTKTGDVCKILKKKP